jgi:hypothetical protein
MASRVELPPRAGDHRHALGRELHRRLDELAVLRDVHGRRLARRADDHDAVGSSATCQSMSDFNRGRSSAPSASIRRDDGDKTSGSIGNAPLRGLRGKPEFYHPNVLFPAGGEPLHRGRARLRDDQVLEGEHAQPPRTASSSSPGARRNAGFEGLPKRSLPCAKVS